MKIKTITCHDVYNVGASLQAYALVTYLRKLGHDAQIIDYKPDYLSNHYPLWGLGNPAYDKPVIRELYNLAKLPGRLKARNGKRKAEYDRFTAEFLPLTPRRYTSNDDLKQNPPEADVYFAGSDQIWNCFFPNGKDPVFLLDSEAWASIEKPVPNTEPYVLLYDFDRNPEMVRFARRMAEENGWKLYSVLSCKECDRCFEQDGPLTFLNLVHHAQFVVFNRQEHINTRMRDLLYGLGLRDCLMDSAGRDCPRIDYPQILEKLDEKVSVSKAYIENVLSEGKR